MMNWKKKKHKIITTGFAIAIACLFLCSCKGKGQETVNSLDNAILNIQDSDFSAVKKDKTANELEAEKDSNLEAEESEKKQGYYIYVCGAVKNPGVVVLPEGSRVQAAVEAAGGMTPEADDTYINLAAKVEDGQKLLIPTKEQAESLEAMQEAEETGMVNINLADHAALCTLSGIGESRAADIIAYREEHGNFAAIEDIMKVPGIKESVFHKIKEKITVK